MTLLSIIYGLLYKWVGMPPMPARYIVSNMIFDAVVFVLLWLAYVIMSF